MEKFYAKMIKHPISILYGIFLLIFALKSLIPMFLNGSFELVIVDFIMTILLIYSMQRSVLNHEQKESSRGIKFIAWGGVLLANLLILLPANEFLGCLSSAVAVAVLVSSFVLFFSSYHIALDCLAPALYCCVFLPYHEEFMLMGSYPLRLSATMLSAEVLQFFGVDIVYSGTSIYLANLNIAITDACSGINQLDAFILISYIAVELLHKKSLIKLIHFAFIVPAIIIGNTVRIIVTILLFKIFGEVVLENFWHVFLGYFQVVLALIIFIVIGKVFENPTVKIKKEEQER